MKPLHIPLKITKKAKIALAAALAVLLAVLFLPLPVPQFYTLTGKCMQHEDEPVSVEVHCIKLDFLWMTDRLVGSFQFTMGNEEPITYVPMSGGELSRVGDDYVAFVYDREKYTGSRNYFFIYSSASLDSWFMEGIFIPNEHLFFVAKDGDIDRLIEENYEFVEPWLRALETS